VTLVPLLLIRHAKAGSRSDWKGDDRLRPLSGPGRRQAQAMVDQLTGYGVERILSSPFLRCVQTVEPLGQTLGLPVEVVEALAEGRPRKALAMVRSLVDGPGVALCTHGDIVPEVVQALAEEDGAGFGPPMGWSKGSTWVLHGAEGRFLGGDYLAPPV
jgi:phosphohistidine phosphatase SixA